MNEKTRSIIAALDLGQRLASSPEGRTSLLLFLVEEGCVPPRVVRNPR